MVWNWNFQQSALLTINVWMATPFFIFVTLIKNWALFYEIHTNHMTKLMTSPVCSRYSERQMRERSKEKRNSYFCVKTVAWSCLNIFLITKILIFRRTDNNKYLSKRLDVGMVSDMELSEFDLEHLEFFSYESEGKFL